MTPIHFRTISTGVLAPLTFVGGAAAQTLPSAVRNSLQVQELITRGDPADRATMAQAYRETRIAQAAAMHRNLAGGAR